MEDISEGILGGYETIVTKKLDLHIDPKDMYEDQMKENHMIKQLKSENQYKYQLKQGVLSNSNGYTVSNAITFGRIAAQSAFEYSKTK